VATDDFGSRRMNMARGDGRKNVEAAMQKLTPARAQEMARSLMQGQSEQVQKVARDLIDWSNKNRQRLADAVQREVRSQLKSLGVASRDEVDALKRRVRELERQVGGRAITAKKPTAARSRAKKPTSATKSDTASSDTA
jgi:polyhydroxyalkanoate synthesis regulator phasin